MNSKKLSYLSIAASLLLTIFTLTFLFFKTPKIAYVRNLDLVYGYNGMKEAHAEFKGQAGEWQNNVDTLKIRYQKAVAYYQQNLKTFSGKEKEEQVALLKQMELDLKNYAITVQGEAKEKETKLTQGVLNYINSFVQNYAKKKGYDIVLGAAGMAVNILVLRY